MKNLFYNPGRIIKTNRRRKRSKNNNNKCWIPEKFQFNKQIFIFCGKDLLKLKRKKKHLQLQFKNRKLKTLATKIKTTKYVNMRHILNLLSDLINLQKRIAVKE